MAFLAQFGDFDASSLDLLQRVLLVSDGTLTDTLEAAFLEPISLRKIAIQVVPARRTLPELDVLAGEPLMERKILLCWREQREGLCLRRICSGAGSAAATIPRGTGGIGHADRTLMVGAQARDMEGTIGDVAPSHVWVGGAFSNRLGRPAPNGNHRALSGHVPGRFVTSRAVGADAADRQPSIHERLAGESACPTMRFVKMPAGSAVPSWK
jgi:hypothetical protein